MSSGKIFLFTLLMSCLALGMTGRAGIGRGELKAETRLKIYHQAIAHYEKAESLYRAGQPEEALHFLHKATKVFSTFPEAYGLAARIYREMGDRESAREAQQKFSFYGGDKGFSLSGLRDQVEAEIRLKQATAPPPDFRKIPALFAATLLEILIALGLVLEFRRLTGEEKPRQGSNLILEKFSDDTEVEVSASFLFKLLVLLLPAPLILMILVLWGVHSVKDLVPMFLFAWAVVDVALYLIFFADLSDLSNLRRPGGN